MRRIWRFAAIIPITVALSCGGAAAAAPPPAWHAVWRAPATFYSELTSVSAISRTNAWAGVFDVNLRVGAPVMHWNGAKWAIVSVPTMTAEVGDYVSASSATNVWVLGTNGMNGYNAFERWNGKRWLTIPRPASSYVTQILTFGPADTWAVDVPNCLTTTTTSCVTPMFHWNGVRWQKFHVAVAVDSISGSASGNVWVAGVSSMNLGLTGTLGPVAAFRWNGKAWLAVGSMASPDSYAPATISASSPTDVWVSASLVSPFAQQDEYVLHWNGMAWSKITVPAAFTSALPGGPVLADGHGGVWYGGAAHLTGGKWANTLPGSSFAGTDLPVFQAMARVPGSSSIWAVGGTATDPVALWPQWGLAAAFGPVP